MMCACAYCCSTINRIKVVATGPRVTEVKARLEAVATILAGRAGARVVTKGVDSGSGSSNGEAGELGGAFQVPELAGRVWLGVSAIDTQKDPKDGEGRVKNNSSTVVGRFVAEYSEDVMRVLAVCLAPLKPALGTVPYESRIHGSTAVPTAKPAFKAFPSTPIPAGNGNGNTDDDDDDDNAAAAAAAAASALTPAFPTSSNAAVTEELNTMQQWTIMQLTDASLPTGGFAHSGGLEAAVQLGILPNPEVRTTSPALAESALLVYLQSALASTASLLNPFVIACHSAALVAGVGTLDLEVERQASLIDEIAALDRELDTLLVSVAPARRASTVQGAALARVAQCWLETAEEASLSVAGGSDGCSNANLFALLRARIGNGQHQLPCHTPCVMGLAAAALGLPASVATDALMFGTTRDMLAAAIRLNLVGPMRAVAVQAALSKTAAEAASSNVGDEVHSVSPSEAAGTAPLLDTVHAMHDMLDMRLFQT